MKRHYLDRMHNVLNSKTGIKDNREKLMFSCGESFDVLSYERVAYRCSITPAMIRHGSKGRRI